MKERLRVFPMKALAALCLLAGVFPVSVLLGRNFAENTPLLWFLPPIIACLWGIMGYLLPPKGRMPFALLGCALFIVYGVLFLLPVRWEQMILILPCCGLLLALPPAWGRPAWEEWPPGAWFGGIVLHLFGQFMSGWPMMVGVLPFLLPSFVVYTFLFMLSLNRHSLKDGMHGVEKVPASLRRRNTVLITAFFLVSLAASCWGRLADWVGIIWNYILRAIAAVAEFLMRLLPAQSAGMSGGDSGMGDLLGGMEESEPNAFALFMEKVFRVLALIALAVLLVLAFRAMYKGAKRLWKRLMEYLRRYAADSGEDYIDETESTVNWEEKTQSIREQMKNVFKRAEKQPRWEELNGQERVRWLYRQFLRRRPEARNKTAREALKEEKGYNQSQALAFTNLYERARYSEEEISNAEADKLRQTIKS